MRVPVLLFVLTATPCLSHAACPAAPVGKPSDGVVQFVTSGTAGFGPTTALDATREGSVIYDSGANQVKYCDGTTWNTLLTSTNAAVPAGAVMAFALTSCPAGWTEYTVARGRFLRGIDNGAGNDPDGTRAPGNVQADEFKSHTHSFNTPGAAYIWFNQNSAFNLAAGSAHANIGTASIGTTGGTETRPKNVALLFCRKT